MKVIMKIVLGLWLCSRLAACSQAVIANPTAGSAGPTPAQNPASMTSTPLPPTKDPVDLFPHCEGMRSLENAVEFSWPNINERIHQLEGSHWTYIACEQPQAEVAALYRKQLPQAPYNLHETNWIERAEGSVGIYYTRAGAWDYVWIVPQANDTHTSYVIIAESFTALSC